MTVNIVSTGAKTLKTVANADGSITECLVKKNLGNISRTLETPVQTLIKLVTPPRVWNTGLELMDSDDSNFASRVLTLENCHNAVIVFIEYLYTGTSTTVNIHAESGNLLRAWGYNAETLKPEALIQEVDLLNSQCRTKYYTDNGDGTRSIWAKPVILPACSFKNIILDYVGYVNSNATVAGEISSVKLFAQPCNIDYKNQSFI